MPQRYFNDFKTKVHVVGVACVDRSIETEGTGRTNIVNHKEITVNKVKDEKRKIVFRDDSYSVDSKSRFAGIVNEIPLNSDELIKALKDAIRNSKKKTSSTKLKDKQKNTSVIEEESVSQTDIIDDDIDEIDSSTEQETKDLEDEDIEASTYPDDLITVIRKMFKECKDTELKASVKNVIAEYGKLNDVDEDGLKRIYDMMN